MALDAEEFDFEGLGSKLTNTILGSFNEALGKIKFSTIGTSLTAAFKEVKMSKVIEDSLTKSSEVKGAMKDIQKKLEDGFNKIKFKVGDITVPELPEQVVKVTADTSEFKLQDQKPVVVPVQYKYDKFEQQKFDPITVSVKYEYPKPELPKTDLLQVGVEPVYEKLVPPKAQDLPITLVPDTTKLDAVKPTIDTGPFEKVGDLVREFVNLTQEANKKTKVTSELYSKIVGIAEKLVATKRMEKDAIDQILASYQQKMDIPQAEIMAEVVDVDTSKVAEASTGPIEVEANVGKVGGGDFSSIEKAMTVLIGKLGKQLQSLFKTFDNKKLNIAIPPTDRLDDYKISYDTISSAVDELKTEVGELSNLELFLSVYSKDTYDIVQKRIAVENLLVGKKREELDIAAQVIGLTNTASLSESQLKALIESKLVSLHKEVELRGLIVNATESYNTAIQQSDLGKLTAELSSQFGLIEDEVAAKATVLALENERVTGVRALTAEQITLLQSEDGVLNKKKEILNADQALLNLNKTIVESNKKIDLTTQTQQLANQLSLLSEEAKLKAELLLQQKLVNGEVAELTNSEKLSVVFLDQQVASSKKFADALAKVGQGQTEISNLVEDLGYDKIVAELSIQKSLTEATVVAQAKSLIAAKVAAGEAAKLTDEELSQLQALNNQIKSNQEILGLKQRIVEATNSLFKTMQDATAEALALEGPMYTQLGLTQDLTREKALAIILDGQRRGLTTDEINMQLQLLKNEDDILQKTRERVNASKDLEAAADAYAQAVRQADADIQIKSLIVALHLTEDEVAQEARLLALKNQQAAAAGKLTKQELEQIKANNGLLNSQVQQLKLNNQTLRHRREEVELVEHVAEYQREVNEELEKYSMGWKKTKATMSAIIKDPAFAKGVFLAGAITSVEKLHHSMHEFMDVGMTAGEGVAATFKTLSVESVMGLSKSKDVLTSMVQETGNMNTLNKDQLNSVGKIAASYGLAGDEAFGLSMAISRMPGETKDTAANFDKTVASVAKMKGVMPSQVMKEMAKNTGNMALFSKGGAEGFAKAAATAKKMGIEVSSMAKAAEGLLDFENSINKQMEASVLLGREINLDKARELALSGDLEGATQEIVRNAGGAAAFDKMNVLQKKALAEAAGLTVEELQKAAKAQQDGTAATQDQANSAEEGLGKVLKLGGGLVTGFGAIAPMLMTITSLMSIMNSGTALGGMIKGMSNFAGSTFEAIKGLTKMVALNVGKALGFGEGSKEKAGGILSKAFGKKTPELPKPEAPAAGGGAGPADKADKLSKINAGSLLKGAAAMLVAAAAIYVFAKAVQELDKVKDWKNVAIGLGLFAASMAITAGILSLAGPGIAIASLALIPFGLALMMFAKAIDIAAPAITMLGAAFGSFVEIVSKNIGGFIAVALGLPLLAAGITTLGIASIFALPAAGALTILGIGIAAFGKLAGAAAPGIVAVATSLAGISKVDPVNFKSIGDGLLHIAKGLGAIGLSGLLALPVLSMLGSMSAFGGAPTTPTTPATTTPKAEAKAVAPAPTTPIAAPAAAAAAPATTTATPAAAPKAEAGGDMKALMGKMDQLIAVLQAGGTIQMDGKKVADIVQRNIRTVKFAD